MSGSFTAPDRAVDDEWLWRVDLTDRRNALHRDIVNGLRAQRSGISHTNIPSAALIEQMAVRREPLPVYTPRSVGTRAYRSLWIEIAEQLALTPIAAASRPEPD